MILSGIFIAATLHPACWSGVFIGCIVLFMLVRELPRTFDTEFWFDRTSNQLSVIKHPWLGRSQYEYYPLPDILEVKVVERAAQHNYPGHDYDDAENEPPIESPVYDVKLSMRSGTTLTIYGAAHLAGSIAEFLGLTLKTT